MKRSEEVSTVKVRNKEHESDNGSQREKGNDCFPMINSQGYAAPCRNLFHFSAFGVLPDGSEQIPWCDELV